MAKPPNRFFGASQRRNEDAALLTGRAQFVGDVLLAMMWHAAFVRSPYASARIQSIDVSAARQRPGVVAVFTAADLGEVCQPVPLVVPPPPIKGLVFNKRTQTPLARGQVRYVGEPVALVIAESRYAAEDAAGDIVVEYEELPAAADLEKAIQAGSPLVHDDVPSNVAAKAIQTKGDYNAAAKSAYKIIKRRIRYEHGMPHPMETRGIVAQWDEKAGRLTVWAATQAPTSLRGALAGVLGMSEGQIRVIAPFVGGGFGAKLLYYYPEELLIPWAARKLKGSIKWIEDRGEHFVATAQERGQIHDVEMALAGDGTILGIKDVFLHDNGAFNPYGLTVPLNSQCSVLGNYVVPNYDSTMICVFTNKPLVGPYRGAGRQHGIFVIERMLDIAARELGIDRNEIRRRNYIPPEKFPYNNELIFQDFTQLTYDSGNYEAALDTMLEVIGYKKFIEKEQPRLKSEGRHVGIGIVSYMEGTGIGPYEGARVHVETGGRVRVATGIGTQGQSHYTTFAQIVAEQLGVAPEQVDVVTGDTDQFSWGVGTFASRGAVVAGNAVNEAAKAVRERALEFGAQYLQCKREDVALEGGYVVRRGEPAVRMALGELARAANPMRGAVQPGSTPGLEATAFFGPERGTTANGVHALIVEVDPETFDVDILRYVVVHDCGVVINPLVVEGQIHGGVAQGIGNAFYERILFNESGQVLNATLADYLLPTAMEVPRLELHHLETPSLTNQLGIKGMGEAGCIPVGAAVAQAIEDALELPSKGIELLEIPLSPERLWQLVQGGHRAMEDEGLLQAK
ncbi:MAG TPA: xanthine dehydrogenase family protein molybdopterin-binding subunit [Hyphomicrobiaceae bacterium]|nr:xanthine dehydrogenase family protein molybdopterin-binding subunit [Hyphomicrobiaceae bacterium]